MHSRTPANRSTQRALVDQTMLYGTVHAYSLYMSGKARRVAEGSDR